MYDYANVGQSAHFADYRDADRQTGRDAFRILHPLGRTVCDQANIEERGKQKMLKRLVRGIITIIGAVAGYGVFLLFGLWMKKNGTDISTVFTDAQLIGIGIVFAILFGIIFFRLTPAITRQSAKVADNIDHDLKEVSANEILMQLNLLTRQRCRKQLAVSADLQDL
jgi:Integral membrane protein (PIN domain superfamily)